MGIDRLPLAAKQAAEKPDASGFREGHEFTRAAKSLKMRSRFSARGTLLMLATTFSATSKASD
jgi:hypothetical protein